MAPSGDDALRLAWAVCLGRARDAEGYDVHDAPGDHPKIGRSVALHRDAFSSGRLLGYATGPDPAAAGWVTWIT